MKKEVILFSDPKAPISESFRKLRTNIQFMNSNKQMRTLLITSALPGEGKSLVTSNLAVTFAQTGKKVVLVDADMRKGRQYNIFDIAPKPGLSNYLSGISENNEKIKEDLFSCIHKTEIENLFLIPAGSIPPNPSELLVSMQMAQLLDELKSIFDLIIIDGTPSAVVTDSIILSRIVDATVIVTSYKQTRKDNLNNIVKNIKNVGGNVTGIVLNKIPVNGRKYQQSYYYGSDKLTGKEIKKRKKEHKEEIKQIGTGIEHDKEEVSREELEKQLELMKLKLQHTVDTTTTQQTGKRGRGRPRKYPIPTEPVQKRKRGRPRKYPVQTETEEAVSVENVDENNYINIKDERTQYILQQMNEFLEDKEKEEL